MKPFLIAILLGGALHAQVAVEANTGYRTPEQRTGIAAVLTRPERDAQQRPEELVAAMQVKPGMTVADIGTGVGYMLPYLSRAVGPSGRVLAEDIFDDFLARARQKAAAEKLANVEFVLGSERDPKLPASSVDVALALDSYHHYDYPAEMLGGIRRALKPGGRLVIADFYRRKGAMGANRPDDFPLKHIRLDLDGVIKEVEAHGFKLVSTRDHIPNSQYMATFEKTGR
jgi:ubiquinone/menaquinone biosynthesis C-methylase UbiE